MCGIEDMQLSYPTTHIFGGLFAIGGILSTIANIVAIVTLWKTGRAKKAAYQILMPLAFCDLLVSAAAFPSCAYFCFHANEMNAWLCSLYTVTRSFMDFGYVGATSSLIAISYYRYSRIAERVVSHKPFLLYKYVILNFVLIGSIFSLSYINKVMHGISVGSIFTVTMTTLCIFYFLIIKKTRQSIHAISSYDDEKLKTARTKTPSPKRSVKRMNELREVRLSKKVAMLILLYGICSAPIAVQMVLWLANIYRSIHLFYSCLFMAYCNALLDPFMYLLKPRDLAKICGKLWK